MSHDNSRIDLFDSLLDVVTKMSDGNPGAVNVLMRMYKEGPAIDPQCAFGPLGGMLALDGLGIYGSNIWVFYKDVCNQDLVLMLGLMRAVQMGIIEEYELKRTMTEERKAEVLAMLKERLELFGRNT